MSYYMVVKVCGGISILRRNIVFGGLSRRDKVSDTFLSENYAATKNIEISIKLPHFSNDKFASTHNQQHRSKLKNVPNILATSTGTRDDSLSGSTVG